MEDMDLKNSCSSANDLDRYLSAKAQNHTYYKTYTTADRVRSWMDSDCFYLDDGSRWNDIHDRETFNSQQSSVKRFGRCFSFSRSESVAMWMLYGGMKKKGTMLEFTKSAMKDLIKNTSFVELGNWVDGVFIKAMTLQQGQFDLTLKDILYADHHDSNATYIRRSTESYKDASPAVVKQLQHCVKSVAWSYENECRLILTVSKNLLPEVQAVTSVRVPLAGLLKDTDRVRIYCSPNFKGEKPYRTSKISDEVDWDLCYGCKGPSESDTSNDNITVPAIV